MPNDTYVLLNVTPLSLTLETLPFFPDDHTDSTTFAPKMDSLIRSTFIDDIPIAARGSTGEDPDEALVTWAPSPSESEHLGTLDEPRDWFWQYWRDIEFDLARSLSETRIPSQPLRDKLVCLYFKHIHPLCPVFDEVEFFASYTFESNGMSFLKAISLLEFQAIMFAGSLVHIESPSQRNNLAKDPDIAS